ncbi:inositol monophosphatase [Candidatus Shapirobacteria bacterium]|nr:inositol monophosphatase [Candidatus Shapirobacteria bacterium]
MNFQIDDIVEAARAGGEVVRKYFGETLEVFQKSSVGDLKTRADVESEKIILELLKKKYPTVNYYSEESGRVENESEYTFVTDPLDETNNFVMGIPDFSVSIGLLKSNQPILGVIYNPILDQVFRAEKGKGAYLNDKKINVNQENNIQMATVGFVSGYNTGKEYAENIKGRLKEMDIKRLIDHWAPAYDFCLLAWGKIEGMVVVDDDLEDFVAGKVILAESGAKITDLKGEIGLDSSCNFIVSNGSEIHEKLLTVI